MELKTKQMKVSKAFHSRLAKAKSEYKIKFGKSIKFESLLEIKKI